MQSLHTGFKWREPNMPLHFTNAYTEFIYRDKNKFTSLLSDSCMIWVLSLACSVNDSELVNVFTNNIFTFYFNCPLVFVNHFLFMQLIQAVHGSPKNNLWDSWSRLIRPTVGFNWQDHAAELISWKHWWECNTVQ